MHWPSFIIGFLASDIVAGIVLVAAMYWPEPLPAPAPAEEK